MLKSRRLPLTRDGRNKAARTVGLYLEQVVHGFSRYHKYSLGTDLRDGKKGNAHNS